MDKCCSSWDRCKDKCETTGCIDQQDAEMQTANLKQVSSFSSVFSLLIRKIFLFYCLMYYKIMI